MIVSLTGLSIDPLNPPAGRNHLRRQNDPGERRESKRQTDIGAVDLAVDLVVGDKASNSVAGTAGLPTGTRFPKQRRRTSRPR
jgi:hypothetical protein